MACCYPWRNGDLQINPLLYNLPALTGLTFAALPKNIPHPLTSLAILLSLSVHSRRHLGHLDHSSLSLAVFTLLHILPSLSIADITQPCPLVKKFHVSSFVQSLKSHFNLPLHGLHFRFLFGTLVLPFGMPVHHLVYFYYRHICTFLLCNLCVVLLLLHGIGKNLESLLDGLQLP